MGVVLMFNVRYTETKKGGEKQKNTMAKLTQVYVRSMQNLKKHQTDSRPKKDQSGCGKRERKLRRKDITLSNKKIIQQDLPLDDKT